MNSGARQQLIELIKERGAVKRNRLIKLAGGGETDIYLGIPGVLRDGRALLLASAALGEFLIEQGLMRSTTAIGGPAFGAVPLVASTTVWMAFAMPGEQNLQWFALRERIKADHGLGQSIEGAELGPDDRVVITDDVVSTGGSLTKTYHAVRTTRAQVSAVAPLIDRGNTARARFEALGVVYRPLLTYEDLGLAPL